MVLSVGQNLFMGQLGPPNWSDLKQLPPLLHAPALRTLRRLLGRCWMESTAAIRLWHDQDKYSPRELNFQATDERNEANANDPG